jgi:N-acetylmuramic acid 6-phosphate etherase
MNPPLSKPDPSVTERINRASVDIDRKSTTEILEIINAEDKKVADAVEREIPRIAEAADAIFEALAGGGRLFYVGAGTSGRLGILDASECPPTFGTDPALVQGVIAGGDAAVFRAQEGAEDDPEQAERDLLDRGLTDKDAVVGLSASGRTPYPIGALQAANRIGAASIAISCNPGSELSQAADIAIEPIVGPEVVTGSTRMKAGTAEKLILNMLSTTVMVKLGRVSSNLMVDLRTGSAKLVKRARRIIGLTTGASETEAAEALDAAGGSVKTAIVMVTLSVDLPEAQRLLDAANGRLTDALETAKRSV